MTVGEAPWVLTTEHVSVAVIRAPPGASSISSTAWESLGITLRDRFCTGRDLFYFTGRVFCCTGRDLFSTGFTGLDLFCMERDLFFCTGRDHAAGGVVRGHDSDRDPHFGCTRDGRRSVDLAPFVR
ncbi:hypothetical protein T484DRAFT_1759499 [Baffinella frigidus]|nr:hypothetical protein T484DRAFT_1759499 [Cryptophyta sp. CCMP2293]